MIEKSKLKRMVRNKGGKMRVLYTYAASHPELRKQHEAYVSFLNENFIPSAFSHAYTKKRSIYTNAKVHLLSDIFIKIDVKNFFPSINHQYLIDAMHFELNKKYQNAISLSECQSLVEDSSLQRLGLPLGLMPSPILSNIYMKRFDSLLYGRLKPLNLPDIKYSRYADDIFISFKAPNSSTPPADLFKAVSEICDTELRRCHLKINNKKTKFINFSNSNHVKIAGINIVKLDDGTRRLTVSRKIIKALYFRAIAAARSQASSADDNGKLTAEINYIKGMQSFILSIEKKGYSHILSPAMKEQVQSLGYQNLEDLITDLKTSD
jgi:retron-type reverse transcriptase